MSGMGASVLTAGRVMLVLKHGYSGASGFNDIKRCSVPTKHFDRRPFWKNRQRRRGMRAEFLGCMHDFSAHDSEHGLDVFDVLAMNGEVVIREHGEVSELARSKGAFFARLT